MEYSAPLTTGKLIRRYKRFLADIELTDRTVVIAHVPNTGSMLSTCAPHSPVAISYQPAPHRKLKWTLELLQVDDCWVGVNTSRTNAIVEEAIANKKMAPFVGFANIRREVKYGNNSRIDLLLENETRGKKEAQRCYIEVKNVTYKMGKKALFPDAVTTRGAKHLAELMQMVEKGHRAAMVYLVNRNDCTSMSPAREIDPTYGNMLDRAIEAGVEAYAYRVINTLDQTVLDKKIPIRL